MAFSALGTHTQTRPMPNWNWLSWHAEVSIQRNTLPGIFTSIICALSPHSAIVTSLHCT
uniref:Uncharacterized protein n=1 Tax=Physcomitrium patens TaxID=3218 RepID=A0A2K1K6K2_PHYPA|nr:hypothetical protein PHYPA_011298 [Physcomitrium patens]